MRTIFDEIEDLIKDAESKKTDLGCSPRLMRIFLGIMKSADSIDQTEWRDSPTGGVIVEDGAMMDLHLRLSALRQFGEN